MNTLNINSKTTALHEVAVICPSFRDYKIWLKGNKKHNENYTWVYRVDCVRGKIFDRVEKIFRYYNIQDIDDILYYLKTHLRRNIT
jgi:hypothetical protein